MLIALAAAIVGAKLFGELFQRLRLPAVLGELTFGVVAGNLALLGGPDLSHLASGETLTVLAELGAVLLLFHVGLESSPREMFAATCSNCGREAQVPFRPTSGKPVYCSDCFRSMRGA